MSCVTLPMLQAAMAIAPSGGASDAQAVLLAALHERYPAVVRWEVHPLGDDAREITKAASVVRLGSRSAVRIDARVYWYTVAGFQSAVSAVRAVPTGEPLDPRIGRIGEVDVLAASCSPLTDLARLEGARARRPLREDRLICDDSIEPRPPVARGDDVTVRYVGQRVSLTTRGVAEADGALGEPVKVKKLDSRDVYRAVVSGEREVTINE